ncbi:hypothetical protein T05_12597 [Trichinella murrelli]|uniref:Uncharacterized protein n=1 Tax=Trichinella murrelli TaxID=144512 RepID=A0A0V0SRD2_9BILA|nr:hypothetical protein T05_12597 [Trichinella murrelli]
MDLIHRKSWKNTSRKHLIQLFMTIFCTQKGNMKFRNEFENKNGFDT